MGEKAQPATLTRVACTLVFSVPLTLHIVYAQGGGKPGDEEIAAAGEPGPQTGGGSQGSEGELYLCEMN